MLVTAEFLEREALAAGIEALVAAGFGRRDIELFFERPVELPRGVLDRPGRTSLAGVIGALLNGGLATAFIYYAQHDYPLVTGGMPLFTPWATGVITYELTMAGAVAGVVLAFLWEAGMLRRRKGAPPLKDGSILLQVRCDENTAPQAAECLSRAGAAGIVTRREEP